MKYLRKQTASLFYPKAANAEAVKPGTTFELDGAQCEVMQVDGTTAWYREAHAERSDTTGESDEDDEELEAGLWETMSTADVATMAGPCVMEQAGDNGFSADPDVRLVRNLWCRKGVYSRVRAVKYMWGLFACNDLLHRRFGRGDGMCDCCPGWGARDCLACDGDVL